MLPTPTTRPNVGEFTTVSIEVNCGVLNTFVACTRTSRPLVSPRLNVFATAMFTNQVLGPSIVFRPASPNVPAGGATKAAMLNHSATLGSAIEIGAPVVLARSVPFTPLATSVKLPITRAVNGKPVAKLMLPLHCQSPNIREANELVE